MKLIHCADWHLDSALETHLSEKQAADRRRELLLLFGKMIDFAEKEHVRAVLIAGDLFDAEPILSTTTNYVLGCMRAHPEIEFFYLHGNHDPHAFDSCEIPENLHVFAQEGETYVLDEVAISGMEHLNVQMLKKDPRLAHPEVQYHVMLLHGMLSDGGAGEDLLPRALLREQNVDYYALGHLHTFQQEQWTNGIACYSGCPVGRGFDECGEKGIVLLDTDSGRLQARFVPLSGRRLWSIKVDISECQSAWEIQTLLEKRLQSFSSEDLVRVTLVGEFPETCEKTPQLWQMHFADQFAFFELRDQSQPALCLAEESTAPTLRGAFVRAVQTSGLSETEQKQVLLLGLQALRGTLPEESSEGME